MNFTNSGKPKSDEPKTRIQRLTRGVRQLAVIAASVFVISGCVTAPFHNQTFDSVQDPVPFQAWTPNSRDSVRVECATRWHANSPDARWQHVRTLYPDGNEPNYDTFGAALYGVSMRQTLPRSCWEYSRSHNKYHTQLRVTQDGRTFHSFDQDGLECLGRENGAKGSITGYIDADCQRQHSNGEDIIYVRIFANGLY